MVNNVDDVMQAFEGRIWFDFHNLATEDRQQRCEILKRFRAVFEEMMVILETQNDLGTFDVQQQSAAVLTHDLCPELPSFDFNYQMRDEDLPVLYNSSTSPSAAGSHHQMSTQGSSGPVDTTPVTDDVRFVNNTSTPSSGDVVETGSRRLHKGRNIPSIEKLTMISPHAVTIQGAILNRLDKEPGQSLVLWLSICLASPGTVFSFLRTLEESRGGASISLPDTSATSPVLMEGLQQLESKNQVSAILRRVYLARLRGVFEQKMLEFVPTSKGSGGRKRGCGSRLGCRSRRRCGSRRSSDVLDVMTKECIPEITGGASNAPKMWFERRKCLANRLRAGKLWHRLSSMYTDGALALLPDGIPNSSLEALRDDEVSVIMSSLAERNHFLQKVCRQAFEAIAKVTSGNSTYPASLMALDKVNLLDYDSDHLVICIQQYC